MNQYKNWRFIARIVANRSPDMEMYLTLLGQVPGRDWYDEVRYDTHGVKKRERLRLPHYHIKIRGDYVDQQQAEENLMSIIDEIVPQILEVAEHGKETD